MASDRGTAQWPSSSTLEHGGRSLSAEDLPRLLNVNEVAEVLGVNVRHVRRLVFEGRIPYLKWGRLVRFDPREIDRWLRVSCEPHRQGAASAEQTVSRSRSGPLVTPPPGPPMR